MNPTEFQKAKYSLSVGGIMDELNSHGVDRGSLVRPCDASNDRGPALAIFLLSAAAVREVGPFLLDVFAEHRQNGQPGITFDLSSNVGTIIEAVEASKFQWTWTSELPGCCLFIILTGNLVNHELSNELTKRGCTTNLK